MDDFYVDQLAERHVLAIEDSARSLREIMWSTNRLASIAAPDFFMRIFGAAFVVASVGYAVYRSM